MGAPDATDSPTDIAEKPSVPAEQPDQGMGPMAWVALGFGAVVLGGAVLLVIRRGRKMKIDEDLL
jgi:hypothetical protein